MQLPLTDATGQQRGLLVLSELPRAPSPLVDASSDPSRHRSAPAVRLMEAARYRYEVLSEPSARVLRVGPEELLSPDDASQRTGRIDTAVFVGEVAFEVELEGVGATTCRVDIMPTKIGDEASFQSMLSDLATLSVEALHQGFAADGCAGSLEQRGKVSTQALADALEISAPSVSGMLKKLSELGLVTHHKYQGATLLSALTPAVSELRVL